MKWFSSKEEKLLHLLKSQYHRASWQPKTNSLDSSVWGVWKCSSLVSQKIQTLTKFFSHVIICFVFHFSLREVSISEVSNYFMLFTTPLKIIKNLLPAKALIYLSMG